MSTNSIRQMGNSIFLRAFAGYLVVLHIVTTLLTNVNALLVSPVSGSGFAPLLAVAVGLSCFIIVALVTERYDNAAWRTNRVNGAMFVGPTGPPMKFKVEGTVFEMFLWILKGMGSMVSPTTTTGLRRLCRVLGCTAIAAMVGAHFYAEALGLLGLIVLPLFAVAFFLLVGGHAISEDNVHGNKLWTATMVRETMIDPSDIDPQNKFFWNVARSTTVILATITVVGYNLIPLTTWVSTLVWLPLVIVAVMGCAFGMAAHNWELVRAALRYMHEKRGEKRAACGDGGWIGAAGGGEKVTTRLMFALAAMFYLPVACTIQVLFLISALFGVGAAVLYSAVMLGLL